MADRNSNLAYDLSRYESLDARRAETPKIKSERAAASLTPITAASVAMVIGIGVMLSVFLTSKADIAAVHADIVAAQAEVAELEQENSRMELELERKSSEKVVEAYAEDVLGMQKLEKSQVEYVSLESGNVVEISEKNDSIAIRLKNFFDGIMEYMSR